MTVMVSRVRLLNRQTLEHWCKGCGKPHKLDIRTDGWDYDPIHPTFDGVFKTKDNQCRYAIRDGKIMYLPGTKHYLLGKMLHLSAFLIRINMRSVLCLLWLSNLPCVFSGWIG